MVTLTNTEIKQKFHLSPFCSSYYGDQKAKVTFSSREVKLVFRMYDAMSLSDILDIHKLPGVVVIYFKGLRNFRMKHWAKRYHL